MTQEVDSIPSIEGLKTMPFCKIFDVAGHQIMFSFELTPLDMMQHATIYVPGLGKVTYTNKRPCDSYTEASRWLESVDHMTARKTLAFLYGKVKGVTRG